MISVSKAITIIGRETRTIGSDSVKLADSIGRVLAQDIVADTDMPPFDRSQMDGYAVKASDTDRSPVTLKLVGESAAGRGWKGKVSKGQAVRIMTGAPLPEGADAVQKLELARESGDTVTLSEATQKGKYIVKKGSEIKKGTRLFGPGDVIDEKMIASLAAFGYPEAMVGKRPLVSILATGSEIVGIGKTPGPDQIRNSNSVMLRALCELAGARPKIVAQTGDDLEKLKRVIASAVKKISGSHVLVLTGGVSVGKYDLTKTALVELGAEMFFERVRLRPGKPTVFARLNETLIFGLPGNPVSAAVTFYLFVRTAILKMQGAKSTGLRSGIAVLSADAKAALERETYLPATLSTDEQGQLIASPMRWHGSSDFVGFARTDALIRLEKGTRSQAGAAVPILFV